jgi:hypothetical protein
MFRKLVMGTMSAAALILSTGAFAQQAPPGTAAQPITPKQTQCKAGCVRADQTCGAPGGTNANFCSDRKDKCVKKCEESI